ncbi:hypothetical protein [Aquimarina agarivorans]|uniref:hypothetical protein n=1 Tax=Aquimarina agarivorans TaxID=980584 RepID=UPI000248FC57|nr:hypothetical protein [Aquimarina agarivorans]
MKLATTYKISGISLAVLFTGVTAFSVRQRIRDHKTGILLNTIQSKINKGTKLLDAENAFDIKYLDKVLEQVSAKVLILQKKVAARYAKQIYSAWGSWYEGGDNEAQVYGIFRKLQDKVQVAQVSKEYQELYATNLIDTLKERFSNAEIKEVLRIVAQLPNYRTIKT